MLQANDDLRKYLSIVVDRAIETDDGAFSGALHDIVKNGSAKGNSRLSLFDEDFYLAQRGSRLEPGTTPLEDYFTRGSKLQLSPHPLIDVKYILGQYRSRSLGPLAGDGAGINPLLIVLSSTGERRAPNALFDPEFYAGHAGIPPETNPVLHYLANWGSRHEAGNLRTSPYFDPAFFELSASRTPTTTVDPLSDYFRRPPDERPDCNPRFHGDYYRTRFATADFDPLSHFILQGAARGISPNPYARQELGIPEAALPSELIAGLLLNYIRLPEPA